jgi:hypothetical protein
MQYLVIPEDVSSYWKSLDPAIRAALIASSSAADPSTSNSGAVAGDGAQGQPMTCSKQEMMMMMATSAPTAPSSTDAPSSNKRARLSSIARVSLDNDDNDQQEDTSSSAPDMSLLPPGATISPTWTKSDWVAWKTTESAILKH